jgi:hypothetical protein
MTIKEIEQLNRDLESKIEELCAEHEEKTGMRCELTVNEITYEGMCSTFYLREIQVRAIVK